MASKKTDTKEESGRLAQQSGNIGETERNLGLQLGVLQRWKRRWNTVKRKPYICEYIQVNRK